MDFLGKTLGNYRIDRLLGEGGMGAVYQAYDLTLQREVAIKLIHPHFARRPEFRERFMQEARLMARLDHPGIVKVFLLGKEGDLLYLPMEFIKGGNLRQLLDKLIQERKWLPLNEALLLVQQLCQVVDYAHQHGVLHRDIKPANLMLKPEPTDGLPFRVVLTDLGLAKLLEGLGLTQEGTSLGTPAYMSPEQASGQPTDPRSDVYSLGILLYELAIGRLPFLIRTTTEAIRYHTKEPPPSPRLLRPDLPESLEQVILKALEKDPSQRYQSAAELRAVLTEHVSHPTEIVDPATQDGVSLVTKYEESVVAPLGPVSASLMTVLGDESIEPRGSSVFGDQSVSPSPDTRIQVIHKGSTARVMKLPSGTVTIGRAKENHIVLDDEKASRRHAQITWDGMEYHVMDLNSSNGTYLENAKLLPGISEILKPNQNLRIGDTWLRIIQPSSKALSQSEPGSVPGGTSKYSSSIAGVVGVSVSSQQLSVEAGGSVTVIVSLINQSPNVDHFSLSLNGIPTAWVVGLPQSVQLMPSEQKEATFTVQVPRSPQSKAGPHPMTLRVNSQRDPSQFVEVRPMLTIAAYSQFKADLRPQRLRAGQPGHLTIFNQGNAQETFSVQFNDAAGELTFEPPRPQLKISEGQSATMEFRTRVSGIRLVGGEKGHAFSAQVNPTKGDPQTLQGEMLSRGLFPVWLPPIILLLCCSSIVLGARYIPPLLFPTPTQTLTALLSATPSPSATPEPGAPVIEQWCVYPSDQPPASSTDCPIQLNIEAGKTVTLEWRVSNAEKVVISPLGDQGASGTISSYTVAQTTTFTIEATNTAQKKIQKAIQVNVYLPTSTAVPPTQVPPTQVPPTQVPPTQVPTLTPSYTPVPTSTPFLLEISQTDGQASAWFGEGNQYINVGQGQSIVVNQAATMKEFSIYLQVSKGDPQTDQIICDFRNASMVVIQSSSINGFSSGADWKSFAFNIRVDAGTYLFTCYLRNSNALEQHTYYIHANANDNSYLEGHRYDSRGGHPEDGSTWVVYPWDLKFKVKMEIQP